MWSTTTSRSTDSEDGGQGFELSGGVVVGKHRAPQTVIHASMTVRYSDKHKCRHRLNTHEIGQHKPKMKGTQSSFSTEHE